MATYNITVQNIYTVSEIINLTEQSDNCSSEKTFTITVSPGDSKFVTILTTGDGTSYTGQEGIIYQNTDYQLQVNGANDQTNTTTGTIYVTVKDKQNGITEHRIILNREHNNTIC